MGNRKKIGNSRQCYKKKSIIRRSKDNASLQENPEQSLCKPRPKTSSSKVKLGDNFDTYMSNTSSFQYEIIDIEQLNLVLGDLAVCKFCQHKIQISKKSIVGLATQFTVSCSNCEQGKKSFVNSENVSSITNMLDKTDSPRPITLYDINLRLVYGLRVVGKGHTAAKSLCGILNLPPPPTMYAKHEAYLCLICEDLCKASMKSAVEDDILINENVRDLCVALDGSWQKRGHTSLNGVMTLTSVNTGKALDYHVMSKHCICPNKLQNNHLAVCSANYVGTSGGMEVAGALILFQRSIERYGVRYTEYLGDGDSSAYKSVAEAKPYGDCTINKLECIGHVQKRMGKRLRDLKNKTKGKLSDGKPLSGKNRLTEAAIQKIQTFYGLAIRRNTHSYKDMQKAVWACYFHIMSTNEKPMHQLCPKDEESWCKFNKSLVLEGLYDHSKHFHLPESIMILLKPIFKQLAEPELLRKCTKGKSQNPNESLNNLIWSRLPKRSFVTLRTLRFGVSEAVLSFNDGYLSKIKVMEQMGLQAGRNMVKAMELLDRKRVFEAEKAVTDLEKKIRINRTLVKRKLEDLYTAEEDPANPTYSAGGH